MTSHSAFVYLTHLWYFRIVLWMKNGFGGIQELLNINEVKIGQGIRGLSFCELCALVWFGILWKILLKDYQNMGLFYTLTRGKIHINASSARKNYHTYRVSSNNGLQIVWFQLFFCHSDMTFGNEATVNYLTPLSLRNE